MLIPFRDGYGGYGVEGVAHLLCNESALVAFSFFWNRPLRSSLSQLYYTSCMQPVHDLSAVRLPPPYCPALSPFGSCAGTSFVFQSCQRGNSDRGDATSLTPPTLCSSTGLKIFYEHLKLGLRIPHLLSLPPSQSAQSSVLYVALLVLLATAALL